MFIYTLDRKKKKNNWVLETKKLIFTNFCDFKFMRIVSGVQKILKQQQQQQQTVIFYFIYLGPVNLPVITSSRYELERRLGNAVYNVARSWWIKGTDKFLPLVGSWVPLMHHNQSNSGSLILFWIITKVHPLSLVPICCRPTCNISTGTAWDTVPI